MENGWIFDKINSMKIRFCKKGVLNGSSYAKILLSSNAILNIENNDKYCFLSSVLACLHPCESSHPSRVSIYSEYFDEVNIDGLVSILQMDLDVVMFIHLKN